MESDSLGSGVTIGSWTVRMDFFNPESPVESDSLGSGVFICSRNVMVDLFNPESPVTRVGGFLIQGSGVGWGSRLGS